MTQFKCKTQSKYTRIYRYCGYLPDDAIEAFYNPAGIFSVVCRSRVHRWI